MSWSIEEHIGEGRPWPEQVVVYRGETDESLTYARRSLSDVNKMVELMDTLAAENAKLRELAERAWKAAEMFCQAWDGPCHADGVSIMPPCPMDERDELCVYGLIQRDLRELGVEVDG